MDGDCFFRKSRWRAVEKLLIWFFNSEATRCSGAALLLLACIEHGVIVGFFAGISKSVV